MSSSLHLNKRRRAYVRLLGEIQHALLEALDEEHHRRGLTRAEIARIIGRNKSFVARKLNGQSNMTMESLADLAFALGRPVKVNLPSRCDDRSEGNDSFSAAGSSASALGPGITAADPASLSNQLRNATWLVGPEPNLSPRAVPADAAVPISIQNAWTFYGE